MTRACLVDTTRCIGCHGCQVACKESHGLKAEKTQLLAARGGYQNPARFSPYTRTIVSAHELEDAAGRLRWIFVKRQCMHCRKMPCADVCAPTVFKLDKSGIVSTQPGECIGCAACMDECPFSVPVIDYWDVPTPHLRKCTFCIERRQSDVSEVRVAGKRLIGRSLSRHQEAFQTPSCARACSTGALKFGDRERLLAEARRRIAKTPERYVDHIYGEKELGGMGWLYLAAAPFGELGFPTEFLAPAEFKGMGAVERPRGVLAGVGGMFSTLMAAACWFFNRRDTVRETDRAD